MRRSLLIFCLLILTGLFAETKYNLDECIEIALKKNPDLVIAKNQARVSRYQMNQAWGSFMPTVSASGSANFDKQGEREYMVGGVKQNQPETDSESFGVGLNVNQPIFNSSIYYGYKLAKNNVQQSGTTKNQTRQTVISYVTEQFYVFLKAQELLKVYEKAHKNSLEQLKKTEEMHRLGQVAMKDVLKAKVKEGGDRLNIINQKQALQTAGITLRATMGLKKGNDSFVVYENIYEPVSDIKFETAKQYCFENNASLRLLEEQRRNAELLYQMEKSFYLPIISAGYSYGRGGNKLERVYSDMDKWWNSKLSLSFNIPIFEGFKRKNKVQVRKIEYNIYEERINKEKIFLESNLDELARTLATYKEMLKINEINLNSAKEDLRLAQEMYKLNSATFLEVLDAQAAHTRAESDIIRIKYAMKVIEVKLKLAMGTL